MSGLVNGLQNRLRRFESMQAPLKKEDSLGNLPFSLFYLHLSAVRYRLTLFGAHVNRRTAVIEDAQLIEVGVLLVRQLYRYLCQSLRLLGDLVVTDQTSEKFSPLPPPYGTRYALPK